MNLDFQSGLIDALRFFLTVTRDEHTLEKVQYPTAQALHEEISLTASGTVAGAQGGTHAHSHQKRTKVRGRHSASCRNRRNERNEDRERELDIQGVDWYTKGRRRKYSKSRAKVASFQRFS